MSDDALDPLIHAPARLRIVVTLAALREGDSLSFPRLQRMLDLTPGNLITHLRKLEDAGYVVTEKSDAGPSAGTSIALTPRRTPGSRRLHRHLARHPRRRLTVRHLVQRTGRAERAHQIAIVRACRNPRIRRSFVTSVSPCSIAVA